MPLVLVISAGFVHIYWIPLHLITFFAGSVACHGALAQMRPDTKRLSLYYVTIALGDSWAESGRRSSRTNLFDRVVEYPLAIVLACLAAPLPTIRDYIRSVREWLGDFLFAGVVFVLAVSFATNQAGLGDSLLGALGLVVASGLGILACVTAQRKPIRFTLVVAAVLAAGGLAAGVGGRLLHIERNFFGVVRVTHDADLNVNRLFHGSTLHGQQSLDPEMPTTVNLFHKVRPNRADVRRDGKAVGSAGRTRRNCGAGCGYDGKLCPAWPALDILRDRRRDGAHCQKSEVFYVSSRLPADTIDIILGDARQCLAGAPDHAYQIIVLDAFSSDAVPVHLLSREAIGLYHTKLSEGGLLVFNLSNRYLDLDPLLGRQAQDARLVCRIAYDLDVSDAEKRAGKQPSIWAVMAGNESDLGALRARLTLAGTAMSARSSVWTDDYSDMASYLILTPGQRSRRDRASMVGPPLD